MGTAGEDEAAVEAEAARGASATTTHRKGAAGADEAAVGAEAARGAGAMIDTTLAETSPGGTPIHADVGIETTTLTSMLAETLKNLTIRMTQARLAAHTRADFTAVTCLVANTSGGTTKATPPARVRATPPGEPPPNPLPTKDGTILRPKANL